MSIRNARNANNILRTVVKNNTNSTEAQTYIIGRALVVEVDTVGGKYNNGKSPRNSIRAKVFKPQLNTNDNADTILWPEKDYDSSPIFPTEVVECIFEDSNYNFGYWISRISDIDNSFVPASENITNVDSQSASSTTAFGVEQEDTSQVTEQNITESSNDFDSDIDKYNQYKKQSKFDKREQDHVVFCKNSARIVLGNDRQNTKDSGYSIDGEAIDTVVGVNDENGDPNFDKDKARIYVSSKSKPINQAQDGESIVFAKADNICLVGRKEFFINTEDGNVSIKIDRNSNITIETSGKINVKNGELVIESTNVTIKSPMIKLDGPVNASSTIDATISMKAPMIEGTNVSAANLSVSNPSMNVGGSLVNFLTDIIAKIKVLEFHTHTVPPAPINPVVSGPPIPSP